MQYYCNIHYILLFSYLFIVQHRQIYILKQNIMTTVAFILFYTVILLPYIVFGYHFKIFHTSNLPLVDEKYNKIEELESPLERYINYTTENGFNNSNYFYNMTWCTWTGKMHRCGMTTIFTTTLAIVLLLDYLIYCDCQNTIIHKLCCSFNLIIFFFRNGN